MRTPQQEGNTGIAGWIAAGRIALGLALVLAVAPGPAQAVEFPPVSAAELGTSAPAREPNAPAIMLFYKGDLQVPHPLQERVTSVLTVNVREKILSEQGLEAGTVRIVHSSFTRLRGFEGRTVLRDGTIVPVPKDARFTTTASKAHRRFITSVAFPSVQVGAILDYRYQLYWDSFAFLEPWYFADTVPVVYSEITYHIPAGVEMGIWGFGPGIDRVRSESGSEMRNSTFRAWAENLESLPAEPYSLPSRDFSPRMMLVPRRVAAGGAPLRLLEDWESTCKLYKEMYRTALRDKYYTAKLAHSLVTKEAEDPRSKAVKLFRHVRDAIRTDEGAGPEPGEDVTVDKVLAAKHATAAEKALLLMALLDAVKVPAHLVWAGDRGDGAIDPKVPTPAWFSRVLVAADVGPDRIFLDPADALAAPGHIPPGLEGMPALLYDYEHPAIITLPEASWGDNRRSALIELEVGEDGSVKGHGTLTLTGHHAWEMMGAEDRRDETIDAWRDWLVDRLRAWSVLDVKVAQSIDEARVTVEWQLAPPDGSAGESEVLLETATPLGPVSLAASFPATGRRTPVLFDFADRDEVEWHVSWSAGWELEAVPAPQTYACAVGAHGATYEGDPMARRLVARRHLDVTRRMTTSTADYVALRELFLRAQRSDAQVLVLRHR